MYTLSYYTLKEYSQTCVKYPVKGDVRGDQLKKVTAQVKFIVVYKWPLKVQTYACLRKDSA